VRALPNGELGVVWEDGTESYYPGHFLRCACQCAKCVDEGSGRKVLRDADVAADVHPQEVHFVGNYGIGIRWSDGHDTGIYTFARLRELDRG
jgi:ATP-binding protein involved in chromosome partitioning